MELNSCNVAADALRRTASTIIEAFGTVPDTSWGRMADHSEWTCRGAASHMADVMMFYALSISGRTMHPQDYVRITDPPQWAPDTPVSIIWPKPVGGTAAIVEVIDSTTALFEAGMRFAQTDRLDFHSSGLATPLDFAAMGMVELMLHGHDVALPLGVELAFDRNDITAVLQQIFPQANHTSDDPWLELLRVSGRTKETRGQDWDWTPKGLNKHER